MNRRHFIKNVLLSSAGFIVLPVLSFNEEPGINNTGELEKDFLNPPASARPQAYWMWMNGHITRKGISLDLQRMKEMGLAGAFIYNTGTGIPKGPIVYGSEDWNEMIVYAMAEAHRLGLELSIHNSPGYSSTGGSWVPPEMSMQQLVWSEIVVHSKGSVDLQLPQPHKKLNYYRDAFVVAYPALNAERTTMKDEMAHIYVNGKEIDKSVLLDKNPETKIKLEAKDGAPAILQIEFLKPFEARAITITRALDNVAFVYDDIYDYPPSFFLEYSDDGNNFQTIGTINMPLVRYITAPGSKNFPLVRAKYFRLSTHVDAWISDIELHAGPRLSGWPGKMNFTDPDKPVEEPVVDDEFFIDPSTVIDITNKLQDDGRILWKAPVGNWTILRFGHTCTGTKTVSAPESASGLEIDKFSKEAVDYYFEAFLAKLIFKLKPFAGKTFKAVLIDSYEIGKQNWTSQFPSEFKKRRGYDITSWLPALTGRMVQSINDTEKFLWDVRRTHADLVADNYYGQFNKRCKEAGLQFYAQPYGDGVFDSLQVGQHMDVPIAEFWTRYVPGTLNICKEAVSIAHGYGKKIVSAEAFTGMPSTSRWTEYPYALKSQGDHVYFQGINRFVFHVFVHQPYTTGLPGLTMGPYGTHFDRNLTWSKQAKEWVTYLTRAQYLLQQGLYVADICYFKGEDPATVIPDVNYVDPPTPRNLAGDVIGPDVLLNRIRVEQNKIVLPDGMSYSLLIMAPLKTISPAVVAKLKELVYAGMILVVASRPTDSPGLAGQKEIKNRISQLTNELWGDLDGVVVKERSFGKGKLYWNRALPDILQAQNIKPDFEFTARNPDAAIHYLHRKMGDVEIYFIRNHLRRKEDIVCSFRSDEKNPELWNPETGETSRATLYEFAAGRMNVPVTLSPAGSLFIVFRNKFNDRPFLSVNKNGSELISTKPYDFKTNSYQAVTNNFTITVWLKPDTYAFPAKGVVIFPPEAEVIYGVGHAACGLSAGQNVVSIFEREKGPNREARQRVTSVLPVEGWTHVAVRYQQGSPSLFINGALVAEQKASGKIIHPGLDTPPTDEFLSASFEGNHTKPEFYNRALGEDAIYLLFIKGLPAPELPSFIEFIKTRDGVVKTKIWENGIYVFKNRDQIKRHEIEQCKTITVQSPWQIKFPAGAGAPASIQLKNLISLHRHTDFNVRHFSGTAVYLTSFLFSEKRSHKNQTIRLDLGRVEAIAEVKLNGKNLGILWKEPYNIDIAKILKAGINELEIAVTNLWPNRMIGDEYLPKENEYDKNGFITQFPDWYVQDKPKPGQRITFSSWNNFKKTDPLLESGLLGPIRLIIGVEKIIE